MTIRHPRMGTFNSNKDAGYFLEKIGEGRKRKQEGNKKYISIKCNLISFNAWPDKIYPDKIYPDKIYPDKIYPDKI